MPKRVAHSFCRTLLLILFGDRLILTDDHGHRFINDCSGTPGARKNKREELHGLAAKNKAIERLVRRTKRSPSSDRLNPGNTCTRVHPEMHHPCLLTPALSTLVLKANKLALGLSLKRSSSLRDFLSREPTLETPFFSKTSFVSINF